MVDSTQETQVPEELLRKVTQEIVGSLHLIEPTSYSDPFLSKELVPFVAKYIDDVSILEKFLESFQSGTQGGDTGPLVFTLLREGKFDAARKVLRDLLPKRPGWDKEEFILKLAGELLESGYIAEVREVAPEGAPYTRARILVAIAMTLNSTEEIEQALSLADSPDVHALQKGSVYELVIGVYLGRKNYDEAFNIAQTRDMGSYQTFRVVDACLKNGELEFARRITEEWDSAHDAQDWRAEAFIRVAEESQTLDDCASAREAVQNTPDKFDFKVQKLVRVASIRKNDDILNEARQKARALGDDFSRAAAFIKIASVSNGSSDLQHAMCEIRAIGHPQVRMKHFLKFANVLAQLKRDEQTRSMIDDIN